MFLQVYKHELNSQITINSKPKPNKSPFSNVDLVWTPKVKHGGTNKVSIEIVYIAHACVCEFLEGERSDVKTLVEWNTHKNLPLQKDINTPSIKNHFNHI